MNSLEMRRELVVVYTVGKVASSTISESIEAAGLSCHDVHVLERSRLLGAMKKHCEHNQFPPPHIATSLLIRREFYSKYSKIKLITLVRDCPSRNISSIFQNLPVNEKISVNEVAERLCAMHFNPFTPWFKNELLAVTGIDVTASPFDIEAKYQYYQSGRFELLLMRTDLDDLEKSRQLSLFLGRDIMLSRTNVASEKWYSALYERFKNEGAIEAGWLNRAIENKFMKHFYSALEREELKQKFSSYIR